MSLCINPQCTNTDNPDDNKFCQSCGSELLLLGRYRVTKLLSNKGGFGNTYEVRENDTAKVLKVLTNDHPHAIELFQQEAEVLNQLNHHGIPKGEGYFNYLPRQGKAPLHCLVMEKIEGLDLEEYQKQHNFEPISQELALEWLSQLARILHEVHRRNFFHRDIKPSNIILRPDGQLTLIDFGAVRQVTGTIMAGGKITQIYTSGYAPPEQERGYAVPQSDFYALGRTFVYLLTGKEPNSPDIYDYKNNELHWRKYAVHIDAKLGDLVDKLIAEKVTNRPANSGELLKLVAQVKQELLNPPLPNKTVSQEKTNIQVQPKTPKPAPILPDKVIYAGFWLRLKAAITDDILVMIFAASVSGFLVFKLEEIGQLSAWDIPWTGTIEQLIITTAIFAVLGTTICGLILPIFAISLFFIPSEQLIGFLPSNWPSFSDVVNQFISFIQNHIYFLIPLIIGSFIKWFYFTASEWIFQATLGKILWGIRVTNLNNQRISFAQSNGRYWAKLISTIPLYGGFLLAGLTPRKRALHDFIAGTITVKKQV